MSKKVCCVCGDEGEEEDMLFCARCHLFVHKECAEEEKDRAWSKRKKQTGFNSGIGQTRILGLCCPVCGDQIG